jgi:hypothetical protein
MTRFHPRPQGTRSILESSDSITCETLAYAERLVELGKLIRVGDSNATPTSGVGDRWESGRNDQDSADVLRRTSMDGRQFTSAGATAVAASGSRTATPHPRGVDGFEPNDIGLSTGRRMTGLAFPHSGRVMRRVLVVVDMLSRAVPAGVTFPARLCATCAIGCLIQLSIFVREASRVLGRRGFFDGLSIGGHAT